MGLGVIAFLPMLRPWRDVWLRSILSNKVSVTSYEELIPRDKSLFIKLGRIFKDQRIGMCILSLSEQKQMLSVKTVPLGTEYG